MQNTGKKICFYLFQDVKTSNLYDITNKMRNSITVYCSASLTIKNMLHGAYQK